MTSDRRFSSFGVRPKAHDVPQPDREKRTVYTVGHSTRPLNEFVALLREFKIEVLADTRSVPMSRHNPQFNAGTLPQALRAAGIEYQHHPLLTGRRRTKPGSLNTAWEHPMFRGYADYMLTRGFNQGIAALEAVAGGRLTAVMCAELAWWRCHRRLIADRLMVDGFEVLHILNLGQKPYPHRPSPGLTVKDDVITYPGLQPPLL